jgi:hypothetical protein
MKWPSGVGDFCFKTYFRKPLDSAVPTNNAQMHTAVSGVDVPVWEVGDSWTYEEHSSTFVYNTNGTYYSRNFFNCTTTYTVLETTAEHYTVKMTSKNGQGWWTYGPYRFKYTQFTKHHQDFQIRKTDLAEVQSIYEFKGPVLWFVGKIGLPLPAQLQVTGERYNDPPLTLMPFPLTAGTNGTLTRVHQTGFQKLQLYWGLVTIYDIPDISGYLGPNKYTCEMADITVPAGSYNAFNVTGTYTAGGIHDYWRTYFIPEIGNFAKQSINIDYDASGKPWWINEVELVSTTYTP